MRISDWSSDVCSSDLIVIIAFVTREQLAEHVDERVHYFVTLGVAGMVLVALRPHLFVIDRKSVVSGKSVSVRVALGGRRIIKTKHNTNIQTLTYNTQSSHVISTL